jgi:hypothetical protein
MIDYQDIAEVLRELDTEAKEATFDVILARFGVSITGIMEAAKQRALRMVMLDRGIPLPTVTTKVPVKEAELVPLAATWLDGFVTGMMVLAAQDSPPDGQHRASGR